MNSKKTPKFISIIASYLLLEGINTGYQHMYNKIDMNYPEKSIISSKINKDQEFIIKYNKKMMSELYIQNFENIITNSYIDLNTWFRYFCINKKLTMVKLEKILYHLLSYDLIEIKEFDNSHDEVDIIISVKKYINEIISRWINENKIIMDEEIKKINIGSTDIINQFTFSQPHNVIHRPIIIKTALKYYEYKFDKFIHSLPHVSIQKDETTGICIYCIHTFSKSSHASVDSIPIICVHGLGHGWCVLMEFVKALVDTNRDIYLVELPGISRHSNGFINTYPSIDQIKLQIERVLQLDKLNGSLSPKKVDVLGHSYGCSVFCNLLNDIKWQLIIRKEFYLDMIWFIDNIPTIIKKTKTSITKKIQTTKKPIKSILDSLIFNDTNHTYLMNLYTKNVSLKHSYPEMLKRKHVYIQLADNDEMIFNASNLTARLKNKFPTWKIVHSLNTYHSQFILGKSTDTKDFEYLKQLLKRLIL